jgi:hypothetical protein
MIKAHQFNDVYFIRGEDGVEIVERRYPSYRLFGISAFIHVVLSMLVKSWPQRA